MNPSIKIRNKRGSINSLGSTILVISGNLDYCDAEKHNKTITTLSDNDIKTKILINEQIMLLQKAVQIFNESTRIRTNNQ